MSGIDMKSPDEIKKIDRKVEAKVKGKPALIIHAVQSVSFHFTRH